jgi:hypothetical protein
MSVGTTATKKYGTRPLNGIYNTLPITGIAPISPIIIPVPSDNGPMSADLVIESAILESRNSLWLGGCVSDIDLFQLGRLTIASR